MEYGGEYVGGITEIIEGFLAGDGGSEGSRGVGSSGGVSSGGVRVREIW